MPENTVGRPMEILLVEDSITCARVTIGALKNGHVQHRLTWIMDGGEALEFLHKQGKFIHAPRPDIILLDLGLPGVDGREVLSQVKNSFDLKDIPVVVMTASTSDEDLRNSELLQVEGYVTKPVHLEKFISLVHDLKRFWHADMILPHASLSES